MNLRQAEVVHFEVQITQIIMRFRMTRVVFQRGGEMIKRFGRISVLRFDNAEIAIGISDAIMRFDGLGV